jgi:hypothetical protein
VVVGNPKPRSTPGLFLREHDYLGSPALEAWLDRARPLVEGSMNE